MMDHDRLRWLALVMLSVAGCRAAPGAMIVTDIAPCPYDRCSLWFDGRHTYRGLDSIPLRGSLADLLGGNDSSRALYAQSSQLRSSAFRTQVIATPLVLLAAAVLPICGVAGGGGRCGIVLVPALVGYLLNLSARDEQSRAGDALGRALWHYNRALPRSPAPTAPPGDKRQ